MDAIKHYNDAINSKLEHDVERFIEHMPQPTMLFQPPMVETPKKPRMRGGGAKAGQHFVLTSGSLPYDYPSSLSVGSSKGPTSLAKEFYGEPDLVNQPFAYGDPSPKLVGGRISRGSRKAVKEMEYGQEFQGGSILGAEMPLGYDHSEYPMMEGGKLPRWLRNIGHTIAHTAHRVFNDPRVQKLANDALEQGIQKGVEYGTQQLQGMGMSGGSHEDICMEGCGVWDSIKSTFGRIANDPRVKEFAKKAFKVGVEKGVEYIKGQMKSGKGMSGGRRAPKWLRNITNTIIHTGRRIVNDPRVRELADKAVETAIQKGTEYGTQQLAGMGRMTQKKFHSLPPHIQEHYVRHAHMSGGKLPKWLRNIGHTIIHTGRRIVNDPRVRKFANDALEKGIQKGVEYGSQQLAGMGRSGGAILEHSAPMSMDSYPMYMGKAPFKGRSRKASSIPAPLTAYSQSSAIYGAGRGKGKSGAKSARGALVSKLMREKGMSLGQASKYIKEHNLL
jgi:hypothetical protein